MLETRQDFYNPLPLPLLAVPPGGLPRLRGGGVICEPRVLVVLDYIEKNLRRDLSVAALSRLAGLSPSRFQHLFKSETGTSPVPYVKSLRMREAGRLLESTDLSVKEVMHRVGVADASHFVRDFKRAMGRTPTEYRASARLRKLVGVRAMGAAVGLAY